MIEFAAAREAMVDNQVRPSDVTRFPIIEALLAVPREEFVPEHLRAIAYLGGHISLGGGRALLDPRVFAKLLDAVNPGADDLVLDIGAARGYSAAVIARMAGAVVALEEDAAMAEALEANLTRQEVDNAIVHRGPLAEGAADRAPYDVIILEGAVEALPQGIEDQLKPGGRIGAIFLEGPNGQARLGLRVAHGIAWRRVFDATAPILPGFAATKAFEF